MEGRKSIYDHTQFVPCNKIIRKNSHVGMVSVPRCDYTHGVVDLNETDIVCREKLIL